MTIEVMKQALEALEIASDGGGVDFYGYAEDLRQAIAEAEKQEPVAWRHDMGEENGGWEYFEEASCPDCQPLYTHPQPKREWVGLTDEEIDGLVKNTRWHELIKATEAKLKEKNT